MHEVRAGAAGLQRFDQARRAEQVGLRRARAKLLACLVRETKDVAAEVDLDHVKLLGREPGERVFAQLFLQPPERGARENLAFEALGGRSPRARANGEVDAGDLRDRPQALLDDRLAEEAGAAGDQDGLALERLGDHRVESSRRS